MFSFLRKKSLVKRAALAGAVLVLLTGFLFISCAEPEPDSDPIPVPATVPQPLDIDISFLHGTWSATNGGCDFFIVDTTAKTFEYATGWGQEGAYAGKILEVMLTETSSGTETSGVIYIQFTAKPEVFGTGKPVEGDYTGIYFLEGESVTQQGFYFPADEFYTPVTTSTLAEAKTTLSLENFDTYVSSSITYDKIAGGNGGVHSSPLEGTWIDEYDSIFTITKTTIVSASDSFGFAIPFFVGDIFKVVKKSDKEGYIVFRYLGIENPALLGKYSVLYWKNLGANSVEMAFAGEDWYGMDSDAVEATAAAAESKYSSGNTSNFDFTDFDKQ